MKKRNKRIVIIVCVSLCVVYLGYVAYNIIIPPEVHALIEHKDAYTRVAEICYQDYLSSSSKDDSEKYFTYIFSVNELYCYNTERALALTDYDLDSMQEVNDTFYLGGKNLDAIRVEENFVTFCTVNGAESYIYSVNNDRPHFVNSSRNNFKKIHVQKVTDHWYYGRVIQQY